MESSPQSIEALEKKIGIKFQNRALLNESLTHKSFAIENSGRAHNERLEFLGDSILNASITEFLFNRYPNDNEGRLSKLKSQLVSRASLVDWAHELDIGNYLKLSQNEESTGGRNRDSLLANVMEALEHGFDQAHKFVLQKFSKKKRIVETDYKSKLQEIIQKKYRMPPTYAIKSESGPDHEKTFCIEVKIKKRTLGQGIGHSKKEAEQQAAHLALKFIKKMNL